MEKEGKFSRSIRNLKEYANLQADMLKLSLLEKSTRILSLIILIFIVLLLSAITIFFFSLALMYELENLWNSRVLAALGIAGIYLILIAFMFLFKSKLFENPLVKQLSKILFENEEEKEGRETNEEDNEKDNYIENESV